MKRRISISLYLDVRYKLKTGRFPVKLQCNAKENGKWRQIYLLTGEELTKDEWERIKDLDIRDKTLKRKRENIMTCEARAVDFVKDTPFMTLDTLRDIYTGGTKAERLNVQKLYAERIYHLQERGQYGTSKLYEGAAITIKKHYGEGLTLENIDKDLLQDFERRLTIAPATIGIYFSTLRAIFNQAITRKLISRDYYPFDTYKIPTGKAFKRALSIADRNRVFRYVPKGVNAERIKKALDAFKFSYYCMGMNMADMARLKKASVDRDVFSYVRKKTAKTERVQAPIMVVIRKEIRPILKSGGEYIFGVLDGKETAEQERKKVMQWTYTTNKWLKKVGEDLKLPLTLTTYVARHTAATVMVRAGVPIKNISEHLGHSSIETTENYLSSLDLDTRRKDAAIL